MDNTILTVVIGGFTLNFAILGFIWMRIEKMNKKNDAMMISDNIEGILKFGTAPIRETFWGMLNIDKLIDLDKRLAIIESHQGCIVKNESQNKKVG